VRRVPRRDARVLFVSKPVVPPWHDGSKNLVRDVAMHLRRAHATVLTTPGAAPLSPRVTSDPIYRTTGRFAPGLVANARVLGRLLTTREPYDVWHFVFAPNTASSTAATVARTARRALGWQGKVVQTVASAPRSFDGAENLLFGDVVVTLSEWTRARLIGAGVGSERLRVIAPCAVAPEEPSEEAMKLVRVRYNLGDHKVVLYPGDYELGDGATTFSESIADMAETLGDNVVFVFACREKTSGAKGARGEIAQRLDRAGLSSRVRHVGEIDDLFALIKTASVVAFPVDDLYGKVDLPLVLLEALALGTPMVLARGGPLEAISTARFVDPGDGAALAREVGALLSHPDDALALARRGKELYTSQLTPTVIANAYDDLYEELLS
jgi:glycosyltransferase involved in cell wall biosynthesis